MCPFSLVRELPVSQVWQEYRVEGLSSLRHLFYLILLNDPSPAVVNQVSQQTKLSTPDEHVVPDLVDQSSGVGEDFSSHLLESPVFGKPLSSSLHSGVPGTGGSYFVRSSLKRSPDMDTVVCLYHWGETGGLAVVKKVV